MGAPFVIGGSGAAGAFDEGVEAGLAGGKAVCQGGVGVYGGAGFCWPSGRIGKDALSVRVEASTLSLIASTKGFVDLASPAAISGRFVAAYEPEQALRARQRVSQLVTDALGRTYWVDEEGGSAGPAVLASRPSAAISDGSTGSPSNPADVVTTTRR